MLESYRKLSIAPPTGKNLQPSLNVRPYHGDVACKLANSDKEVAEQDKQAVKFDQESSQGPAEEDKEDTGGECGSALKFLRAREEDHGFLQTDNQGQSNEEENLGIVSWCKLCWSSILAYVSHGKSVWRC